MNEYLRMLVACCLKKSGQHVSPNVVQMFANMFTRFADA